MKAFFKKVVILGCLCGLTSCATALPVCEEEVDVDYVRIDFAAEADWITDGSADIRETPSYLAVLPAVQTVAIRAPNECLDLSAGRAEGRGDGEVVLQTSCAIYLSELEQSLAGVGFRVVSWDVLDRTERRGGLSSYEAAQNLGAQVIFIINSLETPVKQLAEEQRLQMNYFQANARGEIINPLELTEGDRNRWNALVTQRLAGVIEAREKAPVLEATLDITAVSLPAGESIWFYRRSLVEVSNEEIGMGFYRKFLFARTNTHVWGVYPEGQTPPSQQARQSAAPTTSSSFSISTRTEGSQGDEYRRRQQEMVRRIVQDFATNFKSEES